MDSLILFVIFNITWIMVSGFYTEKTCTDRLGARKCEFLKMHHACFTHPKRMENLCGKTCDLCEKENPCSQYRCPYNKKCVLNENMDPYCKCHIKHCKKAKRTGQICTRSGRIFPNLCVLMKEECKTGQKFIVDLYGECKQTADKCGDAARESAHGLCESWKSHGFCESARGVMAKYCSKTCNLCVEPVAHAPPRCQSSLYGCCWNDNEKSALGPNMEGCRKCKDLDLCSSFIGECGADRNKRFMKKNCPFTCRYCNESNDTKKRVINT